MDGGFAHIRVYVCVEKVSATQSVGRGAPTRAFMTDASSTVGYAASSASVFLRGPMGISRNALATETS